MKFLCVPCDTAMRLEQKSMPEPGSISLVYACPACGYEFAMLTNAHETQVVGSLGVQLGGADQAAGSKCPFTGVVQQLTDGEAARSETFPWTPQAEARMANVPEFVKPMVRSSIERFARDHGYAQVDERVLDEAKGLLGA